MCVGMAHARLPSTRDLYDSASSIADEAIAIDAAANATANSKRAAIMSPFISGNRSVLDSDSTRKETTAILPVAPETRDNAVASMSLHLHLSPPALRDQAVGIR